MLVTSDPATRTPVSQVRFCCMFLYVATVLQVGVRKQLTTSSHSRFNPTPHRLMLHEHLETSPGVVNIIQVSDSSSGCLMADNHTIRSDTILLCMLTVAFAETLAANIRSCWLSASRLHRSVLLCVCSSKVTKETAEKLFGKEQSVSKLLLISVLSCCRPNNYL